MVKIHNITKNKCVICDETIGLVSILMHKTNRLTHSICYTCGKNYFNIWIEKLLKQRRASKKLITSTYFELPCPGSYGGLERNRCKVLVPFAVAYDIFDSVHTYLDVLYLLDSDPKLAECHLCFTIGVHTTLDTSKCVCSDCKNDWCSVCHTIPYHNNMTCAEYKKTVVDSDLLKDGTVKICPNCGIVGSKIEGCNKIHCDGCDLLWCWICESMITGYDHFSDKPSNLGRCKGRLWEGVKID